MIDTSPSVEFHVPDMTCGSCVRHVKDALEAAFGAIEHQIDLPGKRVTVKLASDVTQGQVASILEAAGYTATAVERR